ncbi:hypothetical protein BVY03_05085, partial [bacterium K02(2017)]
MVIDNRQNDRTEERRNEERKVENRRDVERRLKHQPMKTFEAKLTEKTAHEISNKDSAYREAHDKKGTKNKKQGLLDKILSTFKSKDTDKQKLEETPQATDKGKLGKEGKEQKKVNAHLQNKKISKEGEKKNVDTLDSKESADGELSSEGHKKVGEKSGDRGDGGGQNSGGDTGGQSGGQQGFSFDQQSKQQNKSDILNKKSEKSNKDKVLGIQSGKNSGEFDSDARDFNDQDMDQIVESVQIGFNNEGQTEFSVQLTDEYFEGLTVAATRTDDGV